MQIGSDSSVLFSLPKNKHTFDERQFQSLGGSVSQEPSSLACMLCTRVHNVYSGVQLPRQQQQSHHVASWAAVTAASPK